MSCSGWASDAHATREPVTPPVKKKKGRLRVVQSTEQESQSDGSSLDSEHKFGLRRCTAFMVQQCLHAGFQRGRGKWKPILCTDRSDRQTGFSAEKKEDPAKRKESIRFLLPKELTVKLKFQDWSNRSAMRGPTKSFADLELSKVANYRFDLAERLQAKDEDHPRTGRNLVNNETDASKLLLKEVRKYVLQNKEINLARIPWPVEISGFVRGFVWEASVGDKYVFGLKACTALYCGRAKLIQEAVRSKSIQIQTSQKADVQTLLISDDVKSRQSFIA
ncbi:hypothetical protein B0H14DRAFT_2567384 [Mycena olivaceomarginata]|nr:hypothetical protein B0H14DRAFT_2567384 [Mycena olivaceomarginata]